MNSTLTVVIAAALAGLLAGGASAEEPRLVVGVLPFLLDEMIMNRF